MRTIIITLLLFFASVGFAQAQKTKLLETRENPAYLFDNGIDPVIRLSFGKLPEGVWVEQVTIPRRPLGDAIGDCGATLVQLEVDRAGKVSKAKAISGHPLLRGASEKYALGITFRQSSYVLQGHKSPENFKVTVVYFYDWPEARCQKR